MLPHRQISNSLGAVFLSSSIHSEAACKESWFVTSYTINATCASRKYMRLSPIKEALPGRSKHQSSTFELEPYSSIVRLTSLAESDGVVYSKGLPRKALSSAVLPTLSLPTITILKTGVSVIIKFQTSF